MNISYEQQSTKKTALLSLIHKQTKGRGGRGVTHILPLVFTFLQILTELLQLLIAYTLDCLLNRDITQ